MTGGIYVEALVAIAVLAIALVPILGAFAITPAAQRQAGKYAVAMNIARGRLEPLHVLSAADWTSLADQTDLVTQEGQEYTVTRTVGPTQSAQNDFLRDVRVTVTWTDGKGPTAQISLATSVARRP